MCKSRCEKEFKAETKGRRVGLREFPTLWAKGMVVVGRLCFPHSRRLKLGMPPSLPLDKMASIYWNNLLDTEQENWYLQLLQ